MRKLLTLAGIFLVGGLMAQHVSRHIGRDAGRIYLGSKPGHSAGIAKGGSDCIASEDFEGDAIPAGWSIGAQVEQYTDDPNGDPLGTFVDAWAVGTADDANNGGFFDVPDEPAGNIFAYANDDGDPCNCGMADIGLVTQSYDFTGLTGIGLTVRVYHDGQYANSSANIQVSTNGGSSWDNLYAIPEVIAAWQTVTLVLADYEGQADVKFRFQWDDGGGWGTGLGVDDLCIGVLPANDLTLGTNWTVDQPGNYEDVEVRNQEYTMIPLEQAVPLMIAADVRNSGSAAVTEVVLTAEVTLNGTTNTYTSTAYPSLAPGQRDTLIVNTGWTPDAAGEVAINLSVTAVEGDANEADNTGSTGFMVTNAPTSEGNSVWANDDDALTGRVILGADENYSSCATVYQPQTTGSMAYGLGVVFFAGDTDDGALVSFSFQDAADEVAAVTDFQVLPEHLSTAGEANVVNIPFEEPVELDPTMDYFLIADNSNPETVAIGVSGDVSPAGFLGFDNADATFYTYVGWGNPAVMLRLYLAPTSWVGVEEEQQLSGVSIYPNPSTGLVRLDIKEAGTYQVNVFNVMGELVSTQRTNVSTTLDLSGLAKGVYTVRVNDQEKSMVQRLTLH